MIALKFVLLLSALTSFSSAPVLCLFLCFMLRIMISKYTFHTKPQLNNFDFSGSTGRLSQSAIYAYDDRNEYESM